MENDSGIIKINTKKYTRKKLLKIKRLKRMVKLFYAYSLFHYNKALFWKRVYWIGGISSIILSGINTIISRLFNCNDAMQDYNVILGTFITIGLSILTFLNANNNRRNNEDAGDKYKNLSVNLFNDVFIHSSTNLDQMIQIYTTKMEDYTEMFYEPSPTAILKILKDNDFNDKFMQINFV